METTGANSMKTYIITASSITYYTLEIEADSLEEAQDHAHAADGGDFTQDGVGDWEIVEVREATK
jgi:hypothetical protein